MAYFWKIWLILSFVQFVYGYQDKCNSFDSYPIHSDGELIFAQTLCRHGIRNIDRGYKTDPWRFEKFWQEGFSELTLAGKLDQYKLGQYLRRRYEDLIVDGDYSSSKVYVQSTDFDRVMSSAQACMAGMFPPNEHQMFKHNFHWQPIPIHPIPVKEDYLLGPSRQCERYPYLLAKYLNQTNSTGIFQEHRALINYLEINSGQKLSSFTGLAYIHDILITEQLNGKVLPEWTKSVMDKCGIFTKIAVMSYPLITATNEMKKLKSGFLLKAILDRFTMKVNSTLSPDRSLWLYFGHDVSISNMLNSLGLFEPPFKPPFSACIFFELYKIDGNFYVKVSYKGSPKTKTKALKIPHCGVNCRLEEFYKLYAHILPTENFDVECALRDDEILEPGSYNENYDLIFKVIKS